MRSNARLWRPRRTEREEMSPEPAGRTKAPDASKMLSLEMLAKQTRDSQENLLEINGYRVGLPGSVNEL